MGSDPARKDATRLRRFLGAGLIVSALLLIFSGSASAQSILNQSSTGGQTNWLETFTTAGEGSTSNIGRISVLVSHPAARRVTGLKIDDNYNGADNTSTVGTTAVTAQRPNVNGGYGYSRVTFQYNMPTSGTGLSCGFLSGTRKTTKDLRIRAVLDDGTLTPATASNINFVAAGSCTGPNDFPYITARGQTAGTAEINTGTTVNFTYTADDPDSCIALCSADHESGGIRYRARRLSDGAVTPTTTLCAGANIDNTGQNFNVTFPNRGRWVVEAEVLNRNGSGCTDANGSIGNWFYIGSVDVNTPAANSPAVDLGATRPQINGNTTVTATVDDNSDSAQGGAVEAIEWDLNENTGDGVNGYEDVAQATWPNGISAAQRTRTINTTGKSPGLHTVRVRIGDNGALGGADNIRRTATDTVQYLVDTPPVVNDQSVATETQTDLPINFNGGDVDGDSLTYTITDAPDHGTLSGSGGSRTYSPAVGYAGTDSFSISAADGFGGTDTATINIRIDPDTTVDVFPSGTLDDRSAHFEYSSRATGATFECSLDGSTFAGCGSSKDYSDLDDGPHTFKVRALAASNTDQTPATKTWTIDAFPVATIDSGPDPETADTSATFTFSTSETGATVPATTACKLDGGEFRPCTSPETYNDLDDGNHTFTVRATDAYGKTGTDDYTWAVDAVGSNTVIDVAPPAHTASANATIEFSSPDGDATFECSLDQGAWEDCTSATNLTGLSEAVHNFRVRAIDTADIPDPTPAQTNWRVDLTAPDTSFTSGPDGMTNDATPTFEFVADELGATFECSVDAPAAWEDCDTPFTTDSLSEGSHVIHVRATDAVENVEADPATRSFTVDRTGPDTEITSGPVQGSQVSSTSATLEFGSPDVDATEFRCRLDGAPWSPCASPSSQSYSGLSDGDHEFSVRASDAAGNVDSSPATRTWSVDATPPQTSITGGPSGTVRSGDASFNIGSDDPEADFECSLDTGAFEACTATQAFTGLGDGPHVLAARAIDSLGNADPSPATREWTVDTSAEAPPKEAEPRKKRKCTFEKDLPRCGDPYIRARAAAARPSDGPGSFGKLVLKANGGGSPLGSAIFKLPSGLGLRALQGNNRIGAIELFGFGKRRTIPIETGDGIVSGRKVSVEGLPSKVRRLRVAFSSPSLRVETSSCGTKSWSAALTDRAGNYRKVSTSADVRCPRGAGK